MINDKALSIYKNNNPVIALLNFNIAWHTQVMKFILIRYKIFVLFILLLLAPTLSSLEFIVTLPTKNLISVYAPYNICLLSLLTYQGLGLIWVALQQAVFSKQPWEKYLLSLPLTWTQKLLSETLVLFIADFMLWIPLIFASYAEVISHTNYVNFYLVFVKCVVNILLIMLIQLSWRKRQHKILLMGGVTDVIFIFQETLLTYSSKLLILSALIAIISYLITLCFIAKYKETDLKNKIKGITNSPVISFETIIPFTKIQIKNLLIDNISQVMIPFFSLSIILIFSICLIKYSPGDSSLKLIIAPIMLINALILSNIFARLFTQRNQLSSYLHSLPISQAKLFSSDMVLVGSILLTVNFILLLAVLHFSLIRIDLFQISFTTVIPIIFLAMTYLPQLKYKKYGFFISFGMMPFFIWINYLLLAVTK